MGRSTARRYFAALARDASLRGSPEYSRAGRSRSSRTGTRSKGRFLFQMEGREMNFYRTLAISLALALSAAAQVKTEVPAVIPDAKPVASEHIKVHGAALEGNL